jgi:hypothetical protein
MVNYEPELMYALDSKSEYADWKNVYNVSGNDVLYCPICLGRVKLWNGQNPDKTYKKQRCFHHIDGMCSQESRIHFAYKTWLFDKNSKFKVGQTIYEVANSCIEKTFHTKFGDYRPDIFIETINGQEFYVEIANTNKKTNDYIEKWDELGCDVLELDVNEELLKVTTDDIPKFKLIYSSSTGECFIKHYVRQDYDDLITLRKTYWKRTDLIEYKIQWERLDWFWTKLQEYYTNKSVQADLIDAFQLLEPEDQRFICKKMNGKHSSLRYILEKNYIDLDDYDNARLKHIGLTIKNLNKEFGYSSSNKKEDTYLFRKYNHIIFKDAVYWENRSHLLVDEFITDTDVFNFFHPIMEKYYNEHTIPLREEIKKKKEKEHKNEKYISEYLSPCIDNMIKQIHSSKKSSWKIIYDVYSNEGNTYLNIKISLLNHWFEHLTFNINLLNSISEIEITNSIVKAMNKLLVQGKIGDNHLRIMELKEKNADDKQ